MSAQGTEEWYRERAGHVTASCFSDVLSRSRDGKSEGATRAKYRMKLVAERLTGEPIEGYKNWAMERGNLMEPLARMAYEEQTGEIVEQVGFMKHPTLEWCGCSPDGLVRLDGGLQIKCPDVSTHHIAVWEKGVPSEHVAQIQGEMWVTGRKWWDFVSYDPRMPGKLRLAVIRVARDNAYIANLEKEVKKILEDIAGNVDDLMRLANA